MVTEYKFECTICKNQKWVSDIPSECPACENPDLETIDTRERDETKGTCSVGASLNDEDKVNCQLIAQYEADVKSEYEPDGILTRKICENHKKLWDGSNHIAEIREL